MASGQRPTRDMIDRIRAVQGMTLWDEAERLRALMAFETVPQAISTHRAALNAAVVRLPAAFRAHLVRYGLPI